MEPQTLTWAWLREGQDGSGKRAIAGVPMWRTYASLPNDKVGVGVRGSNNSYETVHAFREIGQVPT